MKKTVSFVLAVIMALSLSVTAFAAGEPVTFALTTEKTAVEVGETITVSWAISTDQARNLSVTDNYIYWDETVFKLVGEPVIQSGYNDSTGGYSANYTENTSGVKLIRCGTHINYNHTTTPSVIFTFKLEVIGGAGGTGRIWNDRSQAFMDGQTNSLTVAKQDLTLTINRGSSDVAVTGVSVSPTSESLTKTGETFTVAATVTPDNATNKGVRFTSSDTAVATVNETTGVVTAVSNGTANITATTLDGNYTASCTVTVNIKPMYTLTYVCSGGTYYPPEEYLDGTSVPLDKAPTRGGYTFTGWYLDSACTNRASTVTVKKNMEVYAGWKANYNPGPSRPDPGPSRPDPGPSRPDPGPTRPDPGPSRPDPEPDNSCKRDETCPAYKFDDLNLNLNLWYHDGIHFCVEEDLMRGTAETRFSPSLTTSRAMIVTVLYRLEGEPAVSGENPFVDVAAGAWHEQAVIWAAGNGIVGGYGNGKFGPDDTITREQMAAIMWRYADYKGYDVDVVADLSAYTDTDEISEWAVSAVEWANAKGIIEGISKTELDPTGGATRAQAATILQRYCEKIIK